MSLLVQSRGRELPGTFNPMLISELFQEYSEPWEERAKNHVYKLWSQSSRFLEAVLHNFADDSVSQTYSRLVIGPELDNMLVSANEALVLLFEEKSSHAMTYNHYFTTNVSSARNDRRKKHMTRRLEKLLGEESRSLTLDDIPWLVG